MPRTRFGLPRIGRQQAHKGSCVTRAGHKTAVQGAECHVYLFGWMNNICRT
nr:MAG TPA: hypothetical protein [Caudoviricetes sp.]